MTSLDNLIIIGVIVLAIVLGIIQFRLWLDNYTKFK